MLKRKVLDDEILECNVTEKRYIRTGKRKGAGIIDFAYNTIFIERSISCQKPQGDPQ